MIFDRKIDLVGTTDWNEAARRIEEHVDYLQQMLEMKIRRVEDRLRTLEARVQELEGQAQEQE